MASGIALSNGLWYCLFHVHGAHNVPMVPIPAVLMMCFKNVREANLASNRRSQCSPGSLRPLHLPTQRKSSWLGFFDLADDSVVDHSTFDSSQCASRMVKDHQEGSSFVVHREDGMVQGFKDEEGPTLRIGRTNRFPGWSQFLPTSTGCTQFLCASMPCGSHHIKTHLTLSLAPSFYGWDLLHDIKLMHVEPLAVVLLPWRLLPQDDVPCRGMGMLPVPDLPWCWRLQDCWRWSVQKIYNDLTWPYLASLHVVVHEESFQTLL